MNALIRIHAIHTMVSNPKPDDSLPDAYTSCGLEPGSEGYACNKCNGHACDMNSESPYSWLCSNCWDQY